ncbi:MAG: energy transducer TonB [Spirosomataceae bacterium]
MKKVATILFALIQFSTYLKAQNSDAEEVDYLSQFVEYTVQIPFMAKVAGVQGVVGVEVTAENASSFRFSIKQSLRPDCDEEALRVCKLIHKNYLVKKLNGAASALIEVPFKTVNKIHYKEGNVTEYFDAEFHRVDEVEEAKYLRKYPVDSLTGRISGETNYSEIGKKQKLNLLTTESFAVDTVAYYPSQIELGGSNVIYHIHHFPSMNFPPIRASYFSNGQVENVKKTANIKTEYFPNGRIKKINHLLGDNQQKEIDWYPNGLVAAVKLIDIKLKSSVQYTSVWDTLGKQLLGSKASIVKFFEADEIQEGYIQNGFKQGIWHGKNKVGKIIYREQFNEGVFLLGETYIGKDTVNYKEVEIEPQYKEGLRAFSKYLAMNLKYPAKAQKQAVTGKVYIEFTVCTDGTLCDFNVLKGLGYGCEEEAVRVIKQSSGNWKPAIVRGKSEKRKITMPIGYMLAK